MEQREKPKFAIFCDFDGTVTETDNIIEIMKRFAPPQWKNWVERVLSKEVSIREGVSAMFALLPSTLKEEIVQYLKEIAVVRQGFGRFVEYANDRGIPLYIVSGGLDFFVHPLLSGYNIDRERIFCNGSDFSGDTIRVIWSVPCDEACEQKNDCGLCKPAVMRQLPAHTQVVIGDSVTDVQAAKIADYRFARDILQEQCQRLQLDYFPFDTFDDIVDQLDRIFE